MRGGKRIIVPSLLALLALALSLRAAADPPFTVTQVGMLQRMPIETPFPVFWATSCVLNNKLYVIAGSVYDPADMSQAPCAYVQIYDFSSGTWSIGASKPTPCWLPAAGAADGKIYCLGGRDLVTTAFNKMECYDPATNTWSTKSNYTIAIRGHSAVGGLGASGSQYVAFFGGNTGAYQNMAFKYTPSSDSYTYLATMPGPTGYGSAAYCPTNNKIYYVGGVKSGTNSQSNFNGQAWIYDVATNTWGGTKPNMAVPVRENGIACDPNPAAPKVFVFGGDYWDANAGEENPFPGNQVFDINTNTWSTIDNFPAPFPSPSGRSAYCYAGYYAGARGTPAIYVAGGQATGNDLSLLECYSPAADSWYEPNPRTPETCMRQGPAVAAVGSVIYAIGGFYNGTVTGAVQTFTPSTGAWGIKAAVDPVPRTSAVAAGWNGKIVVCGGNNATAPVGGDTRLYDPAADAFSALAPDPINRTLACGAVVGNTLYVIGGQDASGTEIKSVRALDLVTNTWSSKADIVLDAGSAGIVGAAAQAIAGKLYVVGGYDGIDKPNNRLNDNVRVYDPAANFWTAGAACPYSTYLGASAVYGGVLVQDSGTHLYYSQADDIVYATMSNYLQFYDPGTNTWSSVQRGWGRGNHGVAVVGDRLYSLLGNEWNYLADRLDIFQFEGGCSLSCAASATPTSGMAPLTVAFSSQASGSGCTGTPTFQWNFGDGGTSTAQSPTHTYSHQGTYNWSFQASLSGQTCTRTGTVTALGTCNLSCAASASPTSGTAPLAIQFVATATAAGCAGSPTFGWAFGDGYTSAFQNPSHTYGTPGSFTWVLTVHQDGQTCTRTGTILVVASCTLTCSASASPASGTAPLATQFSATAAATGCAGSPTFSWAFGDGSTSSLQNPSHTFEAPGTFTWWMTVRQGGMMCTRSGTVTVATPPCTLACQVTADVSGGIVPVAVDFQTAISAPHCAGDPVFAWTFGDGSVSGDANPSHLYGTAGVYRWVLTVTLNGLSCSRMGTVRVSRRGRSNPGPSGPQRNP